MAEWPADPAQAAALLREQARAEPIDDRPLGFLIKPWYWLRHLPRETWSAVQDVVVQLLDDPDPLVARRAIAYFDVLDDAMAERFLALAERTAAGPIADDLQRALSRWAGEGDARRVAAKIRKLSGPRGPATMKPVAVYEPEWVIDVAGRVAEGEDWRWAHAAELIAFFDPPLALALMASLQKLERNVKLVALDHAGESLALAGVDQPTLAACRAAIGEPDEAVRVRGISSHTPTTLDGLLDVMIEVLGCTRDSLSPTSKTTRGITTTWSLESPACTIRIELETNYTPADVNSPEHTSEYARVSGSRDGATVTLRGVIGNTDPTVEVDGPLAERDRHLATIWRRLARPRTAWE